MPNNVKLPVVHSSPEENTCIKEAYFAMHKVKQVIYAVQLTQNRKNATQMFKYILERKDIVRRSNLNKATQVGRTTAN